MVRVLFGGFGVDVDDVSKNFVGALLLIRVDVVKENLMRLSVTKILLLLIKVTFHREAVFWKMFGDEACGKVRQ